MDDESPLIAKIDAEKLEAKRLHDLISNVNRERVELDSRYANLLSHIPERE